MTGVCPRGAQVRRVTGNSEAPDSSQNTITARRRRALRQILRPVLGHPAGDGLLVALDGAAGGTLQPPAHAAQQLPGVAGMVAGPGESLDHGGDAGKGQVVGVEAAGAGTLAQRGIQVVELLVVKARVGPGRPTACQRFQPARLPAGDVLAGHPQFTGDLGLGAASGKQRPGLHADVFEGLAVAQTAGVAAIGGWSHTAMLPGCRRNERTSFKGFMWDPPRDPDHLLVPCQPTLGVLKRKLAPRLLLAAVLECRDLGLVELRLVEERGWRGRLRTWDPGFVQMVPLATPALGGLCGQIITRL